MNDQPAQRAFPIVSTVAVLGAAAAALTGLGVILVPQLFDGAGTQTIVVAGALAGGLGVLSMAVVGVTAPFGMKPLASAYFLSMGVRMIGCFAAAHLFIHLGWIASGKPLAASLALVYLPMLLIEVAILARYLRQVNYFDGPATTPSNATEARA